MSILLVAADSRRGLAAELERAGEEVFLSHGLPEAATADLAVLFADTPGLAESTAVHWLRQAAEAGRHCVWVGASLPAGLAASPLLLHLSPPVAAPLLQALTRYARNDRELRERAARAIRQADYLEEALNREHHLARRLLDQLVNNDEAFSDPSVRFWSRPADAYGGDILLLARTPANGLHLMLIDQVASGVRAVASALPAIVPFYRMTEKGFPIEAIVREINNRIFRFHPESHAVAAALASVDFDDGVIQVWHGGTPSPILFRQGDGTFLVASPRPLLGTTAPASFTARTDTWTFRGDEFLALGSSGLLRQIAPREPASRGLAAFHAWLDGQDDLHAGLPESVVRADGLPIVEDMSLILVNCLWQRTRVHDEPAPPAAAGSGEWRMSLAIGPEEMRRVDAVPLLLGVVGQFETTRAMGGVLFVILSELYNNALDHGVLRLESSLKAGPDGMGAFLDERSRRLAELAGGQIEMILSLSAADGRSRLEITCRDSGPGFDHRSLERPRPSSLETDCLPYGRGLSLVASLSAEVHFNDAGNQVRVVVDVDAGTA